MALATQDNLADISQTPMIPVAPPSSSTAILAQLTTLRREVATLASNQHQLATQLNDVHNLLTETRGVVREQLGAVMAELRALKVERRVFYVLVLCCPSVGVPMCVLPFQCPYCVPNAPNADMHARWSLNSARQDDMHQSHNVHQACLPPPSSPSTPCLLTSVHPCLYMRPSLLTNGSP